MIHRHLQLSHRHFRHFNQMLYLLKNLDHQQIKYRVDNRLRHQLRLGHLKSAFQRTRSSTATSVTWRKYQLKEIIGTYLRHLDRHLNAFAEKHLWDHHRCSHGTEIHKDRRTHCRRQLRLSRNRTFHSTRT